MPLDGFIKEDINSYYQARAAIAFARPALSHIIATSDPDIFPDIQRIADRLLMPVQDSSVLSKEQLSDVAVLKRIYAIEERNREEQHKIFDAVVQKYIGQPKKLRRVMEQVVRLGDLIKSAAPHVHENVLDDMRLKRDHMVEAYKTKGGKPPNFEDAIPDSVEHFILEMIRKGYVKTPADLNQALALVHIVSVSTSHPTRYKTSDFTNKRLMFALCKRQLTQRVVKGTGKKLLAEYNKGRGETFGALREWWQADITFKDKHGGPANMTPLQEIMATLSDVEDDFTRNVPEIYRTFDDALDRLHDAGLLPWKHGAAQKFDLTLNLIFSTWTMGDKDGNKKVRSEHLMLMTLLLRDMGAKLYAQELKSIKVTQKAPNGKSWEAYFASKHREMEGLIKPLLRKIKSSGGIDLPLSRQEFLERMEKIKDIYGDIDAVTADFQKALQQAHDTGDAKQKKAVLSLLRRTQRFGLGMLKVQLRETANEYSPVIDNLLRGDQLLFDFSVNYAELSKAQRLNLLNTAIGRGQSNTAALLGLKNQFFDRLSREGKSLRDLREYSSDDPDVITAHTLQRFEVGTLQKGLITDHVLAECSGALQMLETLLISKISGVQMTIVPLLEEHETLTKAIPIFKEAFEQRAWRDHMWEMAGCDQDKFNIVNIINLLKVQYAHSDNMRRMGLPAARANIYEQANLLEQGARDELFPLMLQQYLEDGRITAKDIPKIMRLMDAKPDGYKIRQFHGGSRCDTARGGVRSSIAFTDDVNIHQWIEGTDQGADNPELRSGERFKRLLTTMLVRSAYKIQEKRAGASTYSWNQRREAKIRKAIDRSIDGDYNSNHYGPDNQLGFAMGEAGLYQLNNAYNTPGSRGQRSSNGGVQAPILNIDPVRPEDMRTIGFTSTGLDMGIGFGVLPMRSMHRYFDQLFTIDRKERISLQRDADKFFGKGNPVYIDGTLTQVGLQTLHRTGRIFHAAAGDFPAYGAAISDVSLTKDLLLRRSERGGPAASQRNLEYFDEAIPKDIVGATVPYLHANGYTIPEGFISPNELKKPNAETALKLSFLIRNVTMQHINEQVVMCGRLHDFGRIAREGVFNHTWKTTPAGKKKVLDSDRAYIMRLAGVLRSFYGHVLYDGVADYSMGLKRLQIRPQREKWAPAIQFV